MSTCRQVFLFLCFKTVHSNLDPGQSASIFHGKQIEIIAKKLQKREIIFWNDVFLLPSPSPSPSPSSLLKLLSELLRIVFRSTVQGRVARKRIVSANHASSNSAQLAKRSFASLVRITSKEAKVVPVASS